MSTRIGKILIVEDDNDVRCVYEAMLEEKYEIVHTHCLDKGIEILGNGGIDLVISDYRFNRCDHHNNNSRNLTTFAREYEIPLLMISGKERDERNFTVQLMKPVSYDNLHATIDNIMNTRRYE